MPIASFRVTLLLAAALGFLAVVAGTFGAHGLDGRISDDLLAAYDVGVRYHAYHALALLGLAAMVEGLGKPGRVAAWCFAVGTVIFSGTLYLLALTGLRWLGAITPIGGLFLLAGWASVFIGALRMTKRVSK